MLTLHTLFAVLQFCAIIGNLLVLQIYVYSFGKTMKVAATYHVNPGDVSKDGFQ